MNKISVSDKKESKVKNEKVSIIVFSNVRLIKGLLCRYITS
jgi:hypothetical protein